MMRLLFFVLLSGIASACIEPFDGMNVSSSTTFCSGVYFLDSGISIVSSDVVVSCDGAVFKSWSGGKGFSIEHVKNVTVFGCRVVNYDVGFYVRNSSGVFLRDNHLIKNKEGVRFVGVRNSATLNNDVSLGVSVVSLGSSDNVFSLSNRFLAGDVCVDNWCNFGLSTIEDFLRPEAVIDLEGWLFGRPRIDGMIHFLLSKGRAVVSLS